MGKKFKMEKKDRSGEQTLKNSASGRKKKKKTMEKHTSKKQKKWRRLFVIPEKLAEKVRKSRRQDFATKVR